MPVLSGSRLVGKVWECISARMGWDEAGSSAVQIFFLLYLLMCLFTFILPALGLFWHTDLR